MARQLRPWQRIRAFARKYGADVLLMDDSKLRSQSIGSGVEYAPFCFYLALHRKKKLVYLARKKCGDAETVGGIIHELAHILAHRNTVINSFESEFLGWEHLVSLETNCRRQWLLNMRDYGTRMGVFKGLTRKEKRVILQEGIESGLKYGNITADLYPTVVR